MSTSDAATSPLLPLPPGRRWARRLAPVAFLAALGVALALTFHDRTGPRQVAPAKASRPLTPAVSPAPAEPRFSHAYPPDPVVPERGKAPGHDPVPPPRATISPLHADVLIRRLERGWG